MKFIHFGDVHYEEATHRRMGDDGVNIGWRDVARAVELIVDAAIESAKTEPTVLVFGGDLAVGRKPTPQTYEHIGGQIRRAFAAGVPTIAIPGNHDIAAKGEANALDPLTAINGFHLFNEPGIAWIANDDLRAYVMRGVHPEGPTPAAAVVCSPWIQKSAAAATLPADTAPDEILLASAAAGMAIIRELTLTALDTGVPTFLVHHGTVAGAKTATGREAHLFAEPILNPHDLGALGLSGVLLNHVHKRQSIGGTGPLDTPILYSSSVERLTFGDQDDTKGAIAWTVPAEPRQPATFEYIDTDARRFITLEVFNGFEDVTDAIVRFRSTQEHAAEMTATDIEKVIIAAGAHRVSEVIIDRGEERVQHEGADLAQVDVLAALEQWVRTEFPDATDAEITQLVSDADDLIHDRAADDPGIEVPALPTTDAEFADLPVLDLDTFTNDEPAAEQLAI